MNSEIEKLAPQIWAEIQRAKRILLHFHVYPDGDSIGSALGLYHALKSVGKEVDVIKGDSPTPAAFRTVPGMTEVLAQNYHETDLSQYDLFIILDSAALNRISAVAEPKFPETLKTIVVDHHVFNPRYGQINLVVPDHAATAQIVYNLLNIWKVEINAESATCLFLGMYTDTGGFRYDATTGDTMRSAADLRDRSNLITPLLFELDNNYSPAEIKLDALALSRVELVGKLAMSLVSYADLQAAGLAGVPVETGHIANKLKSVIGWEVGICALEHEPGHTKVSSRTRDASKYDLSKLVAQIGGGGHPAAAGAIVKADLASTREQILVAAKRVCPDLLS